MNTGLERIPSQSNQLLLIGSQPLPTLVGKVLSLFGKAVKVYDEEKKTTIYLSINKVVDELLQNGPQVTNKTKDIVAKRLIEIADPDTRHPLSMRKLQEVFKVFAADKKVVKLETEQQVLAEIENIKLRLSDIRSIIFEESLNEIAGDLRPGDLLIRKYHEDNDNIICTLQHLFSRNGYREAYKCSHLAVYLGNINGETWIAEATMPHGGEAQVRRIKLDDPRFAPKEKNQYLIIRNTNSTEALKMARLAQRYCLKELPVADESVDANEKPPGFEYNFFEAARSLYHDSRLGFYGRHRLLKYFADYTNKIGSEYLGHPGTYFCSHFALAMETLTELNESARFTTLIKKHPVPPTLYSDKKGLSLKIAKIWYSIRKAVWSRQIAFRFKDEIKNSLHTHLDPLRSSPQDTVIYMMDDHEHYKIIGQIYRKSDYIIG